MRKGDILTISIDALDHEGRGVGSQGNKEIHVPLALPGEQVRVRIEHVSPHGPRAWASLVRLEGSPSPARVPSCCPALGECGGCMLSHVRYADQLAWKRRRVERAFSRHPELASAQVDKAIASPLEVQYRNKAKYVLASGNDGRLVYGSYAPLSHRVVDMAGCQVPEVPIDAVAKTVMNLLESERIPPHDERTRSGELRYLVIRRSSEGGILVVIACASEAPRPALARLAQLLCREHPEVTSVVLNVNPKTSGALFGDVDINLLGTGMLSDRIGDVSLVVSARAFLQVNRLQAGRLYAEVVRLVGEAKGLRVLDLYTGVGGIALTLARLGARVVGVESHAGAVEDARRSAQGMGLAETATFVAADAASGLQIAARVLGNIDLLVVNPPRKGLSDARVPITQASVPHLVYVSCGPESLAADLAELVRAGYRVESVQPIDLMPGTPHVETVVSLSRG